MRDVWHVFHRVAEQLGEHVVDKLHFLLYPSAYEQSHAGPLQ